MKKANFIVGSAIAIVLASTLVVHAEADVDRSLVLKGSRVPNVFVVSKGRSVNLTKFQNAHHIYDFQMSLDRTYAFVRHMDFSPTKLSIYDLSSTFKIAEVRAIGGAHLEWSSANTIVASKGCGTCCVFWEIFDTKGKLLYSGPRAGECGWIEKNPTNEWLVDIPNNEQCADSIEIVRISDGTRFEDSSMGRIHADGWQFRKDYEPKWVTDYKYAFKYKVQGNDNFRDLTIDVLKYQTVLKQ